MSSIFISHRNVPYDNAWAERIQNWVRRNKEIDSFLDFDVQHGLQAGDCWEEEVYAAIRRAQIVIALVSPDWLASDWCRSEARMARLLGLKFVPLIISECRNPYPDIQAIRVEADEEQTFDLLRQALRKTHKLPKRPYPGLGAFRAEDAAVFFGRVEETQDLVNKIDSLFQGRPETPRLLLVLGASGSGKSSLVRAGLIPEFKSEAKQICMDPIIPRGAPLDEIARTMKISFEGLNAAASADAFLAALKRDNPDYQNALVPIDQAEELLRGEHGLFFDFLRALLDNGAGRVVVLATMRSDFLNEFQQRGLVGVGSDLDYDTFTLDPLPVDRVNDIILMPAQRFGVAYEPGLIDLIKQDHGGPDALPLLAFFLNEFWRKEYTQDSVLKISEYESFGGLKKALRKATDRAIHDCLRLDPAYADPHLLSEDLQELFIGLLVSISAVSGEALRNRAPSSALTDRQAALLGAFAKQRLLIEKEGEWEVAHEALLRQWKDLRDWIEAAREDLITIDRIQNAAKQWDEAGRQDADLTHTGNRLEEASQLLHSARYASRLLSLDVEYLAACKNRFHDILAKEASLREQAETESVRARKGEYKARRLTRIVAFGALFAIGAVCFAGFFFFLAEQNALRAEIELKNSAISFAKAEAQRARLATESGSAGDGVAIATAAMPQSDPTNLLKIREIPEVPLALTHAIGKLREQGQLHFDQTTSVSFKPEIGQSEFLEGFAPILAAVVSSSGELLVTINPAGVALWNLNDGTKRHRFNGKFQSAKISTDRQKLILIDTSGEETRHELSTELMNKLVTTATGSLRNSNKFLKGTCGRTTGFERSVEQTQREGTATIQPFKSKSWMVKNSFAAPSSKTNAQSEDGTLLAIGHSSGELEVYKGKEGVISRSDMLFSKRANGGTVYAASFSPDSSLLATAGWDGNARIWNTRSGSLVATLRGHTDWVKSIDFSPDGQRLVTASLDGSARIWSVEGRQLAVLRGTDDSLANAMFTGDGGFILTTSQTGGVKIWSAEPYSSYQMLKLDKTTRNTNEALPAFWNVEVSSNARYVAAATTGSGICLADLQSGKTKMTFIPEPVGEVFISEDEKLLVAASNDNPSVWNLEEGKKLFELNGHEAGVWSARFSKDGKWIATASQDHSVRVWSAKTGEEKLEKRFSVEMRGVDFIESSAGSYLVVSGYFEEGSPIKIINFMTGEIVDELASNSMGHPFSIDIDKNGRRIAAGFSDGFVAVWSADTFQLEFEEKAHADKIHRVALSKNGKWVATASEDKTAQVWDVEIGIIVAELIGHERSLHGVSFTPDGRHILTASRDATIRMWDFFPSYDELYHYGLMVIGRTNREMQ